MRWVTVSRFGSGLIFLAGTKNRIWDGVGSSETSGAEAAGAAVSGVACDPCVDVPPAPDPCEPVSCDGLCVRRCGVAPWSACACARPLVWSLCGLLPDDGCGRATEPLPSLGASPPEVVSTGGGVVLTRGGVGSAGGGGVSTRGGGGSAGPWGRSSRAA